MCGYSHTHARVERQPLFVRCLCRLGQMACFHSEESLAILRQGDNKGRL